MAFKTVNAELSPSRGKIGFCLLVNYGFGTHVSIIKSWDSVS
jgi:hypothetical protein